MMHGYTNLCIKLDTHLPRDYDARLHKPLHQVGYSFTL
jgi:hypothetical protein